MYNNSWMIGAQYVWFGISIFLILLLLICRTTIVREAITARKITRRQSILFTVIFTLLTIVGTYWNMYVGISGVLNFRAVGIILAGFVGGPIVGTVTGIIGGIHRAFFIDTDFAYIHGGLSILQGVAAGFLSSRLKEHHHQLWRWALLYSLILEILFWVFFAFFTYPASIENPDNYLGLSTIIILLCSAAIAIFYLVIDFFNRQRDTEKTETTKTTFDAVYTLFNTLHDGFNEANFSKAADLMVSSLPSLIWAAIAYNGEIYTKTHYPTEADKTQGEAEIAILKLQKTLPDLPHLMKLPIRYKDENIGYIIASKTKGETFTKLGVEFLHGIGQVLEAIYEYEKMKEEENLLAEAEIRALQAQINPHFLYNTLNTISYYVRSDPDTARKLIQYLSDYFRHSLNNPSKLIPLSEEIHVIECYTELQRARFGDRLLISYEFPEGKMDTILVPPLLLQPLVENAVIHGVFKRPEGGKIRVGLIEHPKYYKLYVLDTGAGISPAKRKKLLIDHKRRDHIGLINVHQRLLSLFGKSAGLHIVSREGKGTLVFANIPKMEPEKEVEESPEDTISQTIVLHPSVKE